jgi:hypothetical protein
MLNDHGMKGISEFKEHLHQDDEEGQSNYLLDPNAISRRVWDFGLLILLMYTGTYSPYRTAFISEPASPILLIFENVMDVFFAVDIIVNFITPFERYDKSFERDHKKIAIFYIGSGAFFIDVIAAFPFQIFEAKGEMAIANDTH